MNFLKQFFKNFFCISRHLLVSSMSLLKRQLLFFARKNLHFTALRDKKLFAGKCLLKNINVLQKRGVLFKMNNATPHKVVGYYVLFPSIPDETINNNVFLSNIALNEDWPTLSSASPKEMYEGTVRLLMEYGATVLEHNQLLKKDKTLGHTFDTVLEPLLSEEYDVDYAFNTVMLKMMTDWPDCSSNAFTTDLYHLKTTCAREHMGKLVNVDFQNALQTIYENSDLIDDNWKRRLIEWYLLEIRASGLDMHKEKQRMVLSSWSRFIDEFTTKYMINVICTNDQNVFNISDRIFLKYAPPHILKQLAGNNDSQTGPWKAFMEPKTIYNLLTYCSDRQTRSAAWDRWISKASFEHDFYNNSVVIEEIRHNNEGMAKSLGFSSIADHRLSNKMAGTPETIRSFLNELINRVRPVFVDRTQSWTVFAANHEMIGSELRPYDLFYICQREAEKHYKTDSLELMKYFPFWPTFQNVLEILSHLLNLTFQDISSSNLERCHPSVQIYAIADKSTGKHLGRLYIDPFERKNKRGSWNTFLGRPENTDRKLDKIVYMIGSANEPDENGVSLLHYTQLQQLLFNIGRAVQFLLSESPYRDISIPSAPRYAADWDGADFFPKFVELFVYKPNLLTALSNPHVETGELLASKADAFSLALSRSTLWTTYRTLFWSDYDLSICELEDRKKKFWLDMYRELYLEYFPFERERSNYQPCSFIPIHMPPFMSMYYRKLWTEMLAFDIHETFYRENDESSTGERFKNTVLKPGAGELQAVLYRTFQGRDPSIGAICDFHDPPAQIEQ